MTSPSVSANQFYTTNGVSSYGITPPSISASDAVAVIVGWNSNSSSVPGSVTSVTASGVTFTQRGTTYSYLAANNIQYSIAIFVAPIGSGGDTGSFSATTTINFSATMDAILVECLGIAGLHSNSPVSFDANVGLPYSVSDHSTAPSGSYSTTQADDLLIAIAISDGNNSADTATGFSTIDSGHTWPANYTWMGVATQSVSSAQSGTSTGSVGTNDGLVVIDAFSSDSTTPSTTGTWASTEAKDAFAAAGTSNIRGTMAATGTVDTFAATGYEPVAGTWASTEAKDIFAGADIGPVSGSWASTEARDTFAATSQGGVWASTEAKDIFAGADIGSVSGSWASTEARDIFSSFAPSEGSRRRVFFVA